MLGVKDTPDTYLHNWNFQLLTKSYHPLLQGKLVNVSPKENCHLFFFQTLNCISTEKNQTVVFPLPIDLVDGLLGTSRKEVVEVDEDTAEA